MKTIAIGVPYKGKVDGEFFSSVYGIILELQKHYKVRFITDSTYPLDMCRNKIAKNAVEGGCDKILFLDDDVITDSSMLVKLLSYDYDIVNGIYNQKGKPYRPNIYEQVTDNMFIDKILPSMGVQEVDGTGMGLCAIKCDVFKNMEYPWFKNEWFFEYGRHGVISEDLFFCREARKKGYKIMVDPGLQATHTGGQIMMMHYLPFASVNIEFIKDKKALVAEAVEYIGCTNKDVWGYATSALDNVGKEWNDIYDGTVKSETKFYQESKAYIYHLIGWHMSNRREFDLVLRDRVKETQKVVDHPLKIIDVGCGIGQNAIMLAEAGFDVSVMDLPGYTYDFAKFRIKKHKLNIKTFDMSNGRTMNEKHDKYDVVMCFDVLEDIPDEEFADFVAKLQRLKRDDGEIMLTSAFGKTKDYPMNHEMTPEKQRIVDKLMKKA